MVIDVLRSYMDVVPSKPEIHFKGESLGKFDAFIPELEHQSLFLRYSGT